MNLFGLNWRWPFVKAAAPNAVVKAPPSNGQGYMLPISNVPQFFQPTNEGLDQRIITSDPRELWYLALPSKLTPRQVLQILRSALGGDIWQQWQLLTLMLDTWPMFRKCAHELSEAVAYTRFVPRPYCELGGEPSDTAKDKADLVYRAMMSMNPNPFSDEKDFTGMVYNITDAMLNGLMMEELIWDEPKPKANDGGTWEQLPRAAAWVHPRHFTFNNSGQIAVFSEDYQRLQYTPYRNSNYPNPNKFLCAQFMSKSGSSLGCGLMRPLAWYWSAVVYNREWMLGTAQSYGSPFLEVSTKPGMQQNEIAALDNMLSDCATGQRWLRHVEGTVVTIHDPAKVGTDNAQRHLMEEADKACMFLMLGQDATTRGTAGKMGGENSRDKVKLERVEGLAKWVGSTLKQFSAAICRVNYGVDVDEIPDIVPDFTQALDPMIQAQIDQVFIAAGIPVVAEEFYKRNNLTMPEEGDMVIKGGTLGEMAAPQKDVGAPPELQPQLDATGKPIKPIAKLNENETPVNTKQALRWATKDDLKEIESLVKAVHTAPHRNGEVKALQTKLTEIVSRGRN